MMDLKYAYNIYKPVFEDIGDQLNQTTGENLKDGAINTSLDLESEVRKFLEKNCPVNKAGERDFDFQKMMDHRFKYNRFYMDDISYSYAVEVFYSLIDSEKRIKIGCITRDDKWNVKTIPFSELSLDKQIGLFQYLKLLLGISESV